MPSKRDATEPIARPFWSGTIAFGLVSLPVGLYVANRGRGVSLRMIDDDGTPLSRRYLCPAEDKLLTSDEIVRGYEIEKDTFVVVTDEELEALQPEKSREIDLRRFVGLSEIDPAYFERAYFLAPEQGAFKAYRLLARAMEEAGRAGIATFVMRDKEYLVAIIAEQGFLRAEILRFKAELRTPETVGLPALDDVDEKQVSSMEREMKRLAGEQLDRSRLSDRRSERLLELVEEKLETGVDVVEAPDELAAADEEEEPVDVMAILKEILHRVSDEGAVEGTAARSEARRTSRGSRSSLMQRTKAELYERARELDISGRSNMTKEELADAIGGPR